MKHAPLSSISQAAGGGGTRSQIVLYYGVLAPLSDPILDQLPTYWAAHQLAALHEAIEGNADVQFANVLAFLPRELCQRHGVAAAIGQCKGFEIETTRRCRSMKTRPRVCGVFQQRAALRSLQSGIHSRFARQRKAHCQTHAI